ncbi:MAG: Flp family type IVb pilin [Bacillota bacterium]|jgi:Flp pilus assembly pilin Flp|nr:Flp family type IVb pilin [Candidatus Fermentithermobacillaceae bacterium]
MTALYVRTRIWWDQALWRLTKLLSDEQGATVAEYALVLVLVAVALIVVLGDLGEALELKIQSVIDKLTTANPGL